jgi:hypothetical protein
MRIPATAFVGVITTACASELPTDVAPHAFAKHVGITAITVFHADVKGPLTHWGGNRSATLPYWPACANGAFVCGDGTITGFGKAQYNFNIDSFAHISASCAAYGATVVFTLRDASTLTLTETGTVCGPGGSFIPVPAPGGSFGNPVEGIGSWIVETGTGQFAGMTGSGTDTFLSAGANAIASYTGVLAD